MVTPYWGAGGAGDRDDEKPRIERPEAGGKATDLPEGSILRGLWLPVAPASAKIAG